MEVKVPTEEAEEAEALKTHKDQLQKVKPIYTSK